MTALTMVLTALSIICLASGFLFLSLCRVASRADASIENEQRERQLVQARARLHYAHSAHNNP